MVHKVYLYRAIKTNDFEQPERYFRKKKLSIFRNKVFGTHYVQKEQT